METWTLVIWVPANWTAIEKEYVTNVLQQTQNIHGNLDGIIHDILEPQTFSSLHTILSKMENFP